MCTVPEDVAVVSSAIPSSSHSILTPGVFQPSRRKRRREGDSFSTNTPPTTTPAVPVMRESESNNPVLGSEATTDSTLLRRLLAGADLASVRNHSVLVDSNFSLRRTSSMSIGSSRHRSCASDQTAEDLRPRCSTMFSQLTLPRRSPLAGTPEREEEECPRKRVKDATDANSRSSSPLVPVKVESRDPEERPAYHSPDNPDAGAVRTSEKSTPRFPMKPSKRWRLKSPTRQTPSHSLSPPAVPSTSRADSSGVLPMRPRARTTSELDRVFRMFTERLPSQSKQQLERFRDLCLPLGSDCPFDPLGSGLQIGKSVTTSKSENKSGDSGDKASDITSPLSQLLESTPPFSGGSNTIHTRANTTTSVFPWSNSAASLKSNTTSSSAVRLSLPFPGNGSLRIMSTTNPTKPPNLEVLELTKAPVAASTATVDTVASILAATSALTSSRFLQGIRDEPILNFSREETSRPPIPLSLTTDDILQWSTTAASQAAALQQLFRLPESGPIGAPPNSRPSVGTDDAQAARLPIRLAAVNPLLLCRRVAEWMLVANAWTMQMCPPSAVPPNALLATAATYRYCRCSEAEFQAAPPITPTLAMPKVSHALRAVLHRIWPQLLLASMIRENFAFSTVPIPPTELNVLLGRDALANGSASASGAEINIAKMGTANALRSLIEAGNPLLLDTQVLECVRKCIFAQHAFPAYYPVPYATAIDELRQCCHRCSGDASLFNNVILLMNEMQSINPEGLHCLFSIDKLSGLFAPDA
uniref:Protein kinase domain-containing protein n=1 Tax=Mesocestoides corti TaxID=53468 RepID=A0A5K3FKJ1_MESCO